MILKNHIIIFFLLFNTLCIAASAKGGAFVLPDNITVEQDTLVKVQKNRIKKQLPAEFPENYHQELEDYYARQKFYEKILRKIGNAKNYLSFSTNMLFDAVLIPNIAVEFQIMPKWSLYGNWMYAWWSVKKSDIYWRTYGGDITLRHWFGKKSNHRSLTGHHIGAYCQAITYDFDFGGQAQMTDKWNYGFGIEYGHSFAISKDLNIDIFAGIGVLIGKYKDYSNVDDHYKHQVSVERFTVLPTKLGASLVWILPLKRKSILYEE